MHAQVGFEDNVMPQLRSLCRRRGTTLQSANVSSMPQRWFLLKLRSIGY